MSQALYRTWRPQTFDDVVGQEPIVHTLRNALRLGHIHHAYLFAGPRGTGKTTIARLLAKAVNCLAPAEERPCNQCEICTAVNEGRLMDLIEIDAASNTGVDDMRELLDRVGFRPSQSRYKVYVVDEVHMLSTSAFNALLKTLEEPPSHVIFMLATTEVHKIPATVVSRCQRFEFRRIPLEMLIQRLQQICDAEGIQAEAEALDLIARAATGSLRDAISLLDQMAADKSVTADYVRLMLGAERREVVQSLAQFWLERDLNAGLQLLNRAVDGGADPRQLARQISDFLRGLLLMRLGAGETWTDPTTEERPRFAEMAQHTDPDHLVKAIRLFSEAASERRIGWQPQLPLELALVEATLDTQSGAAPQSTQSAPSVVNVAPRVQRPVESVPPTQSAPAAEGVPIRVQLSANSGPLPSPRTAASPVAAPAPAVVSPVAAPVVSETPAAFEPRPADTAVSSIPFASIVERWREILRQLSPPVAAPLWDARPLGVDAQGALVLGFRHGFHLNKTNAEGYRQAVEDVLSKMFSQKICLRCVLEKDWQAPNVSPEEAPQPAPVEAPRDADPLGSDVVVQRAVEELGAVPKIIKD